MRILNFGSLNIDHVYHVARFVRPGETINSRSYSVFAGGKGNNQSIALARAGAQVHHAGRVGTDGIWLRDTLAETGVHVEHVAVVDAPTGHAIIQVNRDGENAIVLHGGANRSLRGADATRVLAAFDANDTLLLQNEISAIPEIMREAAQRGLRIVFNPAPMDPEVASYPLDCVDTFIVNETEGEALTGAAGPSDILAALRDRYPRSSTLLTLGDKGAQYAGLSGEFSVAAEAVEPVDTTAAGDTFIGYFLSEQMKSESIETAMRTACRAATLCVTRPGAVVSIPLLAELATSND